MSELEGRNGGAHLEGLLWEGAAKWEYPVVDGFH